MIEKTLGELICREEILSCTIPLELVSELPLSGITDNSRKVEQGSLFFAFKGERVDARTFSTKAVELGAKAIVVEDKDFVGASELSVPLILVKDLRLVFSLAASRFYSFPSSGMKAVGVTGTNGKTSVAWLIASAIGELAGGCLLLGTLGRGVLREVSSHPERLLAATSNTTPDPLFIQSEISRAYSDGVKALAAEVTSQGMVQSRTRGMQWDVAVFMNLTRDHLDLHGTLQEYARLKKELFHLELRESKKKRKTSVINIDDAVGRELELELRKSAGIDIIRFSSADRTAEVFAKNLSLSVEETAIELNFRGQTSVLCSRLVGRYNVSNILACVGSLLALNYSLKEIQNILPKIPPVPGRLERVMSEEKNIFIDYAHTPDALVSAQEALSEIAPGRLITVFGCGGDRDRGKRPLMGQAVAERADFAVVTSDNPRSEDPESIIAEIVPGIMKAQTSRPSFQYRCIADRRGAIEFAIQAAGPKDVVLIAGKGHEDYQEIKGVRHPFLDRTVCEELLGSLSQGK